MFREAGIAADQGPQRPKIHGVAFGPIKSSDFQKASETYSKWLGLGTYTGTIGCTKGKSPCDKHKAIDQLHKNGLPPARKFADDKAEIGRDGKWQLNLYDPDGTRVELMEFTPVQTPCCSSYTGPHPH